MHKYAMKSKEEEQKFAWNSSLLSNDKEDMEFYALLEALKNSTQQLKSSKSKET